MLTAQTLLLSIHLLLLAECATWDYKDNGDSWVTQFQQFCSGRRQSPIDLSLANSSQSDEIRGFVFSENLTNADCLFTLENTGHSLQLSWQSSKTISFGVKNSDDKYTAVQLHWHWGSTSSQGSEHTVESTSYPLEAHLVFYNSKDYSSFSEAAAAVNGLAVLGIFYELHSNGNSMLREFENHIGLVNMSDSKVTLSKPNFNLLAQLLPTNRNDFYRYDGSLTTPTCNENVMWTVFKEAVPVSESQLQLLRRLKYPEGNKMVDNFRRVQALNPEDTNRPGTPRVLFRTFAAGNELRAKVGGVTVAALVVMATARLF